jgi:hypothetical protein
MSEIVSPRRFSGGAAASEVTVVERFTRHYWRFLEGVVGEGEGKRSRRDGFFELLSGAAGYSRRG